MDLLNERGLECIRYKEELLKGYPPLVQGALIDKVQGQLTAQIITLDVYQYIVDPLIPVTEMVAFLSELAPYSKSKEERLKEMSTFQENLEKELIKQINVPIQLELHMETELLVIACPFKIGLETTMGFFGVNQKQAVELMKRKGFVEKFAVLRLEAIFKEFLLTNDWSFKHISVEKSFVYLDSATGEYGIDVLIRIPFQFLKNKSFHTQMVEDAKKVVDSAWAFYNEKMGQTVPVLEEE